MVLPFRKRAWTISGSEEIADVQVRRDILTLNGKVNEATTKPDKDLVVSSSELRVLRDTPRPLRLPNILRGEDREYAETAENSSD